jgi:ribosome-associated translation inhibitor RaiA
MTKGEKNMDSQDFRLEFYNEAALSEELELELAAEADRRLRELAEGHTDIIDASVSVEELTGAETPHRYQVRVVVYMRPDNVVAVEKQETVKGALKGALSAVERQVREVRQKLREQWKQP